MENWTERRLLLEQLQVRTSGQLTEGQAETLSSLVQKVSLAEAGQIIRRPQLLQRATGLLIGQHLKEPELIDFIKQLSPSGKTTFK